MRLPHSHTRSIVSRRGHYSGDGSRWSDEPRGRWYPVTGERETVEIELEDGGGTSLWAGVATTLAYGGAACVRFVGHVRGPDGRATAEVVRGPTFMRLRSIPDDLSPEQAWAPDMKAALADVERRLLENGWLPAGKGEQPLVLSIFAAAGRLDAPVAVSSAPVDSSPQRRSGRDDAQRYGAWADLAQQLSESSDRRYRETLTRWFRRPRQSVTFWVHTGGPRS